ncbi:uncharacterized protein [Temnothorax nylanderi]|uniref:uncharacterized protein n=1 Tax=Temnothorax nylanderi TaxID=102681 RepID=UPI003A8C7F85
MGEPPAAHIMVEDARVSVEAQMKVLGLWLDGTWSFGEHFARLTPRALAVANGLARLMPNLGGASGRARRLYAGTVHAVALYGAPIWAPADSLVNAEFGQRTVDTIRPCLADWLDSRRHGLSYHAVQVLTGHGCFGKYLHRIGKEVTTCCHHCDEERDTAQHTLEYCPAWAVQRRVLMGEVGGDLSLPTIVAAMVGNERRWRAFLAYCSQVMSAKEEAERIRRGEADPPSPPDLSQQDSSDE